MVENTYDVIVIGGGIIAANISYFTAKKGLKVLVLEKNTIASGTSSKCDGNVLLIDKEPGFDSKMTIKSQSLINQLSNDLEMPFEYRQPGSIFVCSNEEELEQAYKWAETHNSSNRDNKYFNKLTKEDLKNDSKYFSDHLVGAIECNNDATVNPYLLTFSLINEAQKYDCTIKENSAVLDIIKSDEGTFKVLTESGEYIANKVVNAAGVWAPKIGQMLNVDIPIKPRKGHILVASRTNLMATRKIQEFGYLMTKFEKERKASKEMNDHGIAFVFEPTASQNFLIGSSREFSGYSTKVNSKIIRLIAKRAMEFFPAMSDLNIIRSYAGLRPWTPDHFPIISETSVKNFFVAAGHEGDGIGLSAVTGLWMSELLTNELTDNIDDLSISRFTGA